ncbi:MAG: dTMP kinase [Clostridia bacterium]|nr:dTMP kinase [Clostridia bacterium]
MIPAYTCIVFDLDGTLTDSREGIYNSIRYALDRNGFSCPGDDTLRRFLGPPLAESFMTWCGMTEEEAAIATESYRERYVPRGMLENAVYPGIPSLLRSLREEGVFLAVATGKPLNATRPILEHFGLWGFFSSVACPALSDLHADKAVLIRRALNGLPEKARERVLMVGDIPGDILGGQRAGCDTCAALWGYGDNGEMLLSSPTFSAEDPDALFRILRGDRKPPRGPFISFEGVDGCGKSTQIRLFRTEMEKMGYRTLLTREPGGCPISEQIRSMLLTKEDNGMCDEAEALLFAAARAQHLREVILPALSKGWAVISDRYLDSSLVYQGAGRGLGMEWVRAINRPAIQDGMPDVTVILTLDPAEALRRRTKQGAPDRIEKSGGAFFDAAGRAFRRLAEDDPLRCAAVDAGGTEDEVASRVRAAVLSRLSAADPEGGKEVN